MLFRSDEEKKKKVFNQLKKKDIEEVDGKDIGGGVGATIDQHWPTNNP